MVIDGNDDRGIDVGIMARPPWQITEFARMWTTDDRGIVFSRDCPEFSLRTESGKRVVVLVNHLKSKGYASVGETPDKKRERQAKRVATIYRRLRQAGEKYVAIVGDFNDFRSAAHPAALHEHSRASPITSYSTRAATGSRQGVKEKFDYVLLSPDLFSKVSGRRRLPARRLG